ncbi:MAG: TonB-dependent receptor [Robiginitomaculum sp.]|nr:TonB-dependent receptor [Robiginitomaculum sp.]
MSLYSIYSINHNKYPSNHKNRSSSMLSSVAMGLALTVTGAGLFSGSASAQSEESTSRGFDEIIVTARKREESVEKTPIAISAFTGDTLERRGVVNIVDVSQFVPNLNISTNGGGGGSGSTSSIFLRGIGQTDFLITTDPGVGLYIDGVYFARATATIMDLLDLERIEVLRGPQGTLFGKNTIGGAISLISAKPNPDGGGKLELRAGQNNYFEGRVSVDVPISDTLNSRFSALYKTKDGYTDRLATGEREGDERSVAARAMFNWVPTDQFTADLAIDYSNRNGTSAETAVLQFDPTAPLAGLWAALVGGPNNPPVVVNTNPRENGSTGPNVDDNETFGVGLTLEYDFGNVVLKSITAARTLEAEFGRDGDGTSIAFVQTNNRVVQQQYSQELQLTGKSFDDRLDWVGGLYYFNELAKDTNDVRLAEGLFAALEGLPAAFIPLTPTSMCPGPFPANICAGGAGNPINAGLDLDFDIFNKVSVESYALFGSGTFALSDKINVTAGLRYTDESKEYFLDHSRVNAGVPIIPPTTVSDSWSSFSPKFSLDYQAGENTLLYTSVSRGFKSGGFNGRPTSQGAVDSFDPEFVWSYEAGVKTSFADRRVLLSAAAFVYDYQDIQLTSIRADDTGNLLLVTENAGTATIQGFEAELRAMVTDNFIVDASLGLLDAEYGELNPGATVTTDLRLTRTPEFTTSIGAEYTFPISDGFDVTVRGDYSYQSSQALDPANTVALIQDGYGLLGGRLILTPDGGNWEVALFGTNLTNELYLQGGLATLDSFGAVEGTFGLPSEWGIATKLKF